MKIVSQESRPKIAEYYCDLYTRHKAYSSLKITCGYGSEFDLNEYQFDLSDAAVKRILDFIQGELPIKDKVGNHCKTI